MASLSEPVCDLRTRAAALVQTALQARRIAISRELAAIPPPVPACDVDFNRLLEDRGRVADELQRLNRLLAGGASNEAMLDFCRDSTFLTGAVMQEIESLLGRR
jgi:hypothetical protein